MVHKYIGTWCVPARSGSLSFVPSFPHSCIHSTSIQHLGEPRTGIRNRTRTKPKPSAVVSSHPRVKRAALEAGGRAAGAKVGTCSAAAPALP